jgi:DNA-binding transcriptional regulator YdaS (Cro superfamily)
MSVVEPVEEVRAHIAAFYDGNQSAFAKATGFSTTYVSDVLSGRRDASERLLAVLGLKRAVVKAR